MKKSTKLPKELIAKVRNLRLIYQQRFWYAQLISYFYLQLSILAISSGRSLLSKTFILEYVLPLTTDFETKYDLEPKDATCGKCNAN